MDSQISDVVDLFGLPVVALRERRGRPSFAKTLENQQFVAVRAAAGWSQDRIAEDMGVDPKTLRKNFSRELEHGAIFVEGQMLDVLLKRARDGHAQSIKVLLDRLDMTARRRGRLPGDGKADLTKALGKKDQQMKKAKEQPEDWADLLGDAGEKSH